ncbi:MAG: alpha/beta hydrolase [Micromonosporaceae bacterium]
MDRGVVIIPGAMLGPHQPLLSYTWLAGRLRGAEAYHVEWPADRPSFGDSAAAAQWVNGRVAEVLDVFAVARPVLAGKSLGTFAAALAAERGLPGIWHTPVLTAPECVAALRRASAPYLLIGGTADELWDGDLARELTPHVLEIPDADHGMILEGQPLARSAEVLGRVVTAIEDFLDRQVWPT